MAVSRSFDKKSPNQNPVDFYKLKQYGGPLGRTTQKVPDVLKGGPMREPLYGRKDLSKT
jgi:hypothetical protein